MSGAGLGGALGTAAGVALAPETGGMSMLIPALAGAAGSAAGGYLTGDHNIGRDAIAGGVGGALPGIGNATGITGGLTGMLGGAGANALEQGFGGALSGGISSGNLRDALLSGLVAGAGGYMMPPGSFNPTGASSDVAAGAPSSVGDMSNFPNADSALSSVGGSASAIPQAPDLSVPMPGNTPGVSTDSGFGFGNNNAASDFSTSSTPQSPGLLSRLGGYVAQNPLQSALAGSIGLSALQSLLPRKQVDIAGTANSVKSTDPNFTNPNLPPYHITNNYTPYTGNWYTYGQQPEAPMDIRQAVPGAKHGGLIGYSHGGQVRKYATGGQPQMPVGASPQIQVAQQKSNPLASLAAFKIGHAIGNHLRQKGVFTGHGQVNGQGGGQDDLVPAKLSKDEFVLPSDVVSHLGDGSSDAGSKRLHGMIHNVRAHKATKGFPPKAKNPLKYLGRA